MTKLARIAAVSVLATGLGGWAYIGIASNPCDAEIDQLKTAYQQKTGEFGHGEMMSGLRNAESYCDIGDEKLAHNMLELLERSCRNEGGCA